MKAALQLLVSGALAFVEDLLKYNKSKIRDSRSRNFPLCDVSWGQRTESLDNREDGQLLCSGEESKEGAIGSDAADKSTATADSRSSIQQEVVKQEPKLNEVEEEEEGELSAEEQGRRIASQWTQDPEASGRPKEAVSPSTPWVICLSHYFITPDSAAFIA